MREIEKIKKIVREARSHKETAREQKLQLGGQKGKRLEEILKSVRDIENKLEREHQQWIKNHIQEAMKYLREEISEKELREAFQNGLETYITLYYRLYKSAPEKINKETLEDLIKAYTFDFIRSLRNSKRLKIPPRTALELAELSYRLNPNIIPYLKMNYPTVDEGIIIRAAVNYPTDPEKFIEETLGRIERLREKYPGVDEGIIKYAAVHNTTNPEEFIEKTLGKIEELREKYPKEKYQDIDEKIIKRAAVLYPKKPEEYIDKTLGKIEELREKYPKEDYPAIEDWIIKYAAVNYPTESEKFIEETLGRIERLREKYPGVSEKIIKDAAVLYPTNPEEYIEKYLRSGEIQ